ncbi:MAG: hypothetical protein ACO2ON_02930 [Candidatus Nanopusillus sp.]
MENKLLGTNRKLEIDFILTKEDKIIPIEVKHLKELIKVFTHLLRDIILKKD